MSWLNNFYNADRKEILEGKWIRQFKAFHSFYSFWNIRFLTFMYGIHLWNVKGEKLIAPQDMESISILENEWMVMLIIGITLFNAQCIELLNIPQVW